MILFILPYHFSLRQSLRRLYKNWLHRHAAVLVLVDGLLSGAVGVIVNYTAAPEHVKPAAVYSLRPTQVPRLTRTVFLGRVLVFVLVIMRTGRRVVGEGDGVYYVLQVLVLRALRPPGDHFAVEFLVHGQDVFTQAAGFLHEAGQFAGVVLVYVAGAGF
jgi:hypothetical protein